jgi:hypothetical protein
MDAGTILTSTVAAAVVSGVIGGIYALRSKQREYVNEYYKIILTRRIAAYEQLERLVLMLKIAVLDEDKKPYHLLFSRDDDWQTAYDLLGNVMTQALWLSDDAFRKTQELNYLMFRFKPGGGVIEFGKANYRKIADLRVDLERIVATDLLALHDVDRFLRQKKNVKSEFNEVRVDNQGSQLR